MKFHSIDGVDAISLAATEYRELLYKASYSG